MPLDGVPDGYAELVRAIVDGITPDAELWLDEWSEQNVELPKEIAAEHGDYDPDRTVGAREIVRWRSPAHPCPRAVVVGPLQFLKPQVFQIGRASCRESGCQSVEIWVVGES